MAPANIQIHFLDRSIIDVTREGLHLLLASRNLVYFDKAEEVFRPYAGVMPKDVTNFLTEAHLDYATR